jgi:hypothetical protein
MRFTSIAFGLTAFLSAFVVAAPAPENEVTKRMPTPEEFNAMPADLQKRVYQSWYRATNILPASDDKKKRSPVYQSWYRATNILPASDD